MKVIWLEIRTWVGTSIGAQHTYGTLKWRDTNDRDGSTEEELTRPRTAKEAKAENAEAIAEGQSWRKVKAGDATRGFADEPEVIRAGIKRAAEMFKGEDYILVKGDSGSLSAMPLLAFPERFTEQAKRINEVADEWRNIGGYGYSWSAPNKERDKRAEELDSEWLKLMAQIAPEEYAQIANQSSGR